MPDDVPICGVRGLRPTVGYFRLNTEKERPFIFRFSIHMTIYSNTYRYYITHCVMAKHKKSLHIIFNYNY